MFSLGSLPIASHIWIKSLKYSLHFYWGDQRNPWQSRYKFFFQILSSLTKKNKKTIKILGLFKLQPLRNDKLRLVFLIYLLEGLMSFVFNFSFKRKCANPSSWCLGPEVLFFNSKCCLKLLPMSNCMKKGLNFFKLHPNKKKCTPTFGVNATKLFSLLTKIFFPFFAIKLSNFVANKVFFGGRVKVDFFKVDMQFWWLFLSIEDCALCRQKTTITLRLIKSIDKVDIEQHEVQSSMFLYVNLKVLDIFCQHRAQFSCWHKNCRP